ncbi:MAG: hypothetical protein AB1427_13000 [Thermodesulfobacteriota bacterium]
MAEIKSTLDLVMEKTRHLRLSREEKEAQNLNAFKKKLNGLLQQYGDKVFDLNRFGEEFKELESGFDIDAASCLKNEILDKLTLEQPGDRFMGLLGDFCGADTEKLNATINAYQTARGAAAEKRTAQIKAVLAENRHISGGAVIPNLDADSHWRREVQAIRNEFEQLLEQEKKLRKASDKSTSDSVFPKTQKPGPA